MVRVHESGVCVYSGDTVYFEEWLEVNGYDYYELTKEERSELYDEFEAWAESEGLEPQYC